VGCESSTMPLDEWLRDAPDPKLEFPPIPAMPGVRVPAPGPPCRHRSERQGIAPGTRRVPTWSEPRHASYHRHRLPFAMEVVAA